MNSSCKWELVLFMLTALASPKTKVDENLSHFKANVFDSLAVAGCDLCVRACWVKEKALHKTVKSAEKIHLESKRWNRPSLLPVKTRLSPDFVPLPLASSLTPMLPLAELSRPSSGVSSATSSSSLQMDEDGVPYVLSCTGFILGVHRPILDGLRAVLLLSLQIASCPYVSCQDANDLHCNVKVTSMSHKTAPFLTIKTTMPPLNAATPAAAATLTTTASS